MLTFCRSKEENWDKLSYWPR